MVSSGTANLGRGGSGINASALSYQSISAFNKFVTSTSMQAGDQLLLLINAQMSSILGGQYWSPQDDCASLHEQTTSSDNRSLTPQTTNIINAATKHYRFIELILTVMCFFIVVNF
jgi:hypothetical protein